MSIDKLRNKYGIRQDGPAAPANGQDIGCTHWRDSQTVSELSDVLKQYAHFGVRLIWDMGSPVLRFNPPLSLEDTSERWAFADYVTAMAVEARRDLITLVNAGLLRLPSR